MGESKSGRRAVLLGALMVVFLVGGRVALSTACFCQNAFDSLAPKAFHFTSLRRHWRLGSAF